MFLLSYNANSMPRLIIAIKRSNFKDFKKIIVKQKIEKRVKVDSFFYF